MKVPTGIAEQELNKLLQSAGEMSASHQPGDTMEQEILQKIRVLSSSYNEDSESMLKLAEIQPITKWGPKT